MKILLLSLVLLSSIHAATIRTVAGTGEPGYDLAESDPATTKLDQPFGVIVDPQRNIYFCDTNNHLIRMIDGQTGKISTLAGNGKKGYSGDGGDATWAMLNEPYELRLHPSGELYWVERLNHIVRKMNLRTKVISTVAGTGQAGFSGDGGAAIKAQFNQPHSIQFDQKFETLYICDISNNRIRAVEIGSGKISTWCGNGKKGPTPDGSKAGDDIPLNGPRALDIAPNGDLWLALREGNAVYRIDAKTHKLEHIAGTGKKGFTGNGGPAKDATLSGPKGVALSPDGKLVYLVDTESHTIRAIDLSKNPATLELIAGDGQKGDGPDSPDPLKCRMARPHGIGVDPTNGDIYIGDSETHKIRVVSFAK